MNTEQISIIMGSDSDLPVVEKAFEVLKEFNVKFEVKILSAHRTPKQLTDYVGSLKERGIKVVIAAAGGAAHLPGVIASYTILPVIGVPIKSKSLGGLDSLFSIVQMPSGVPVATVSINGAKNAALLALQIIALNDDKLSELFINYKNKMSDEVIKKNEKLDHLF